MHAASNPGRFHWVAQVRPRIEDDPWSLGTGKPCPRQCPRHKVRGRVSSYPGWALQGWCAALRMMSRWDHLIQNHVLECSVGLSPVILCKSRCPLYSFGTEEFEDAASPRGQGHSFASTPQTAGSLQYDKLARDWMISCGRSATTTRLAPPAWNLTRHSVPCTG